MPFSFGQSPMNCTSIIGHSSICVSSASISLVQCQQQRHQFPPAASHHIITTDGHIQVVSDDITLKQHSLCMYMYFSCPAVTPSCSSPIVLLRQGPFPLHTPLPPSPSTLQATPPPASRNFWTCPGTFESRIPHSRSPASIVTSRRLAACNSDPRNMYW